MKPDFTWKYVLHILFAEERLGWIGNLSEIAYKLGYPFILWNDHIYEVDMNENNHIISTDTGYTIKDIK